MVWFLSPIFDWSFMSKSFLVSVYESCSCFPTINPKNDPRLNHFLRGRPQAINRALLPFLWKVLFINNIEHIYTYMDTHIQYTHTHAHNLFHSHTVSSPLTVRIQSGLRGCALSLPDLKYKGRIVNWERKESEAERNHFYRCLRSMLKLLLCFMYINTTPACYVYVKTFKRDFLKIWRVRPSDFWISWVMKK